MGITALVIALSTSSCCSSTLLPSGGRRNIALKKKATNRNTRAWSDSDLTEDIGFWTRMAQEAGSMPKKIERPPTRPTRSPTNRPVSAAIPTEPKTPIPTSDLTTPSPVTPILVEPHILAATEGSTPSLVTPVRTTSEPTKSRVGSCGLTVQDRADQFRRLALTVTDEDTLDAPDSSQARALDWLVNEDRLDPPLCPAADNGPCEAVQRYIMASFYFAAGGGEWDQCNTPRNFTSEGVAAANRSVTGS